MAAVHTRTVQRFVARLVCYGYGRGGSLIRTGKWHASRRPDLNFSHFNAQIVKSAEPVFAAATNAALLGDVDHPLVYAALVPIIGMVRRIIYRSGP